MFTIIIIIAIIIGTELTVTAYFTTKMPLGVKSVIIRTSKIAHRGTEGG